MLRTQIYQHSCVNLHSCKYSTTGIKCYGRVHVISKYCLSCHSSMLRVMFKFCCLYWRNHDVLYFNDLQLCQTYKMQPKNFMKSIPVSRQPPTSEGSLGSHILKLRRSMNWCVDSRSIDYIGLIPTTVKNYGCIVPKSSFHA